MTTDAMPFVFRNALLSILLAMAINSRIYGRTRAAKLVAARPSLRRRSSPLYVRGAIILFGGAALGMRLIQSTLPAPQISSA